MTILCGRFLAVCGSRGPGLADAEPRGPVAGATPAPEMWSADILQKWDMIEPKNDEFFQ
jgi:hypothetical protein